jgi:hypothetical protein
VSFIAAPAAAPSDSRTAFAHPDDPSDQDGQTWRDRVNAANKNGEAIALGFLPAWQLYLPPSYAALRHAYGDERLFILSAGWGLVRADMRLPAYDITFSGSGLPYKRRRHGQRYIDLNALENAPADDTVFFGGKDYLPLFLNLSSTARGRRVVFYNSSSVPTAPGCMTVRFLTRKRTNWHYDCADALLSKGLQALL